MNTAHQANIPYPTYRDSGVDWLGEIPEHWGVVPLKYKANIILGKMLCTQEYSGYSYKKYLKSKNIQWLQVDVSSIEKMYFSKSELLKYRVKKGDLIVSEGGEVGKTCYWNDELPECYIQNSAHIIRFCNNNLSKYFLYVFFNLGKSGCFECVANRVSIAHLTQEKLANMLFAVPPLPEQQRIAAFLDNKTALIEKAIALKSQHIALLKERLQIIIQTTVTQGLNKTTPLKNTGVDWLGKIPEHWEVKKLKYVVKINKRIAGKEGFDVLSITQSGIKIKNIESGEGQLAENYSGYQLVQAGDFAMNHMDLLTGYVDISKHNGVISPDYRVFICDDKNIFPNFLLVIFQMGYKQKIFYKYGQGVSMLGRWRFPAHNFNNFVVPIPPLPEQQQITDYLEQKSTETAQAIAVIERQLRLLQEYKTTLINASVTGKICLNPKEQS